jgi:hypothetical protein
MFSIPRKHRGQSLPICRQVLGELLGGIRKFPHSLRVYDPKDLHHAANPSDSNQKMIVKKRAHGANNARQLY